MNLLLLKKKINFIIIAVVWSSVSGIVWGFLKTTAQNIRKPGGFFSPEIRSAMKTNSIKGRLIFLHIVN